MDDRHDRFSPRTLARVAGWLYLYTILSGLFAEVYVAGKIVVAGDPKATAANLLANETLFRAGVLNEMLGVAAYVAILAALYALLKAAGKNLALASVLFGTVGNTIWIVGGIYQFAALRLLHGTMQMPGFNSDQVQALAYQCMKMHDSTLGIGMIFFGVYCILIGILASRSEYFPRALGWLLVLGGAFDIGNEMIGLVAPALNARLPDALQLPGFIAEAALTVWLLTVGTKTDRALLERG